MDSFVIGTQKIFENTNIKIFLYTLKKGLKSVIEIDIIWIFRENV